MESYSWLVTTRNNADKCKIKWESINTENLFKSKMLQICYENRSSLETLQDVATMLDDTKLMGYLNNKYLVALRELSKNLIPFGSFPRIYYDYEGKNQLWGLEFIPGTENINILK